MNQVSQIAVIGSGGFARPHWRAAWWQAPVIIALVGWLYSPILYHLLLHWREDSNYSHGFLVPAFSLFVLWRQRSHLLGVPRRPSLWGLLIVAFSLLVLVTGVLGAELFLARVSFLLIIAGLVVTFLGFGHVRAALFPLLFLFLMIPIPAIVFNEMTFPLQVLGSRIATRILPWFGVPVLREGNIIHLAAMSLEVAEACSGIRSLLSLITLSVIYGYIATSSRWIRIALVVAAVPIAVISNSLRLVVAGLLVQYWSPTKAEGFFHSFSGWLVFLASVAMLFLFKEVLTATSCWRMHGHN